MVKRPHVTEMEKKVKEPEPSKEMRVRQAEEEQARQRERERKREEALARQQQDKALAKVRRLREYLPPIPAPLAIKPSPVSEATTYDLPGKVNGVAVGGAGRFLIFRLEGEKKLAVFDSSAAAVTHHLAIDEAGARFTAGMNCAVVYLPESGKLVRYNLLHGQEEARGPLDEGKLTTFCMGSASDGPLLLVGKSNEVRLVNVRTLLGVELPFDRQGNALFEPGRYWAGANGRSFGFVGESILGSVRYYGETHIRSARKGPAPLYIQPGPDGGPLFLGGQGVVDFIPSFAGRAKADYILNFSRQVIRPMRGAAPTDALFVPAHHGPFYAHLQVGTRGDKPRAKLAPVGPALGLSVYLLDTQAPVAQFDDSTFPKADELRAMEKAGIGFEQVVHIIPDARLIVAVASSRDKLLLYPFDPEKAVAQASYNEPRSSLVVASRHPAPAVRGQAWSHTMAICTKADAPRYRLRSGPKGLKVSADGKLTWEVPDDTLPLPYVVDLEVFEREWPRTHRLVVDVIDPPGGKE